MELKMIEQNRWQESGAGGIQPLPAATALPGGYAGLPLTTAESGGFGVRNVCAAILVVLAAMLIVSCQKDPLKNLSASESRIYITNHDSTADFSRFSTFSIADSVGVIEDNQGQGKALTAYDAAVIDAVRSQMEGRGYRQVARAEDPDLGITVSRVYNNYTGLISYPAYWDRYGSFYDPFYWGYGGYDYYSPYYYGPTFYSTYQVTQGALTVDMLNLKDAKDGNTIHPVWSALARGTGTFNVANTEMQVKTFFDQSPYLLASQ